MVAGFRAEDVYAKLDVDGLAIPGSRISPNDCIIGKTSPLDGEDELSGHATKTLKKVCVNKSNNIF